MFPSQIKARKTSSLRVKARLDAERRFQEFEIFAFRDFCHAKLSKMLGLELRIEKHKPPFFQSFNEVYQSHFRGICLPRKHAFAKKRAAKRDAVQPANQLTVRPGFDRMAVAALKQLAAGTADWAVDPGAFPAGLCFGTAGYDPFKIRVDP
jgi:hypothetical protein